MEASTEQISTCACVLVDEMFPWGNDRNLALKRGAGIGWQVISALNVEILSPGLEFLPSTFKYWVVGLVVASKGQHINTVKGHFLKRKHDFYYYRPEC